MFLQNIYNNIYFQINSKKKIYLNDERNEKKVYIKKKIFCIIIISLEYLDLPL